MNLQMPAIHPSHRKVIALLQRGENAASVAIQVGLSRKRIFDIARRHKLPTNPHVTSGGRIETQIVQASRVLTIPEIALAFRTAESRIKKILSTVDRQSIAKL